MLRLFAGIILVATLCGSHDDAWAAYQNPTIAVNEQLGNGAVRLTFRFTGNAGEPTVLREYTVTSVTTPANLRNWVHATLAELDTLRTTAQHPALQVGQTITPLAGSSTKTARATWREKVELLSRFQGTWSGSLGTALAALKADIEDTYQAGFLDVD